MTPEGWLTEPEAATLRRHAKGRCLEVGTAYGRSASVLAPLVDTLWCVDPHDTFDTWGEFLRWLTEADVRNVIPIRAKFEDATGLLPSGFDFAFIDGCHKYESVRSDLTRAAMGCPLIALHDFGYVAYPGVRQAVEEFLAANPKWSMVDQGGMIAVLKRKITL